MAELPTPVAPLLRAIQTGWDIGASLGLNDKVNLLFNYARNVAQSLNALTGMMLWVMQQEKGAVDYAYQKISSGAEGFAEIAANEKIAWSHLLDTILPNSLGFAVGWIFSNGITPLRVFTRDIDNRLVTVTNREHTDAGWLYNYVVPGVRGWYQFVSWWDHNFARPAAMLIDWVNKPSDFGTWAAPPLIGPLIAYLAAREHRESRDNLTEIIIDAAPDKFRHVEAAALAILRSPYP